VDQSVAETPTVRRSRMFRLLCDVVAALARKNPTVIVIEDLQWADASTTELVRYLAEQCGRLPLMIVLTMRSDFTSTLVDAPHVHRLTVDPLSPPECSDLFAAIAGEHALPATVREELLSKADGVPLFIEELIRAVLERSDSSTTAVLSAVPNTLRGLLISRIDRLHDGARGTIHLAAALS